jgi:hypothetical protein
MYTPQLEYDEILEADVTLALSDITHSILHVSGQGLGNSRNF